MREAIIEQIERHKLIAIIRGIDPKLCLRVAKAISEGGINLIEVTFDQRNPDSFPKTAEAIAAIDKHFGGEVLVGAGTVLDTKQLRLAAEAGAKYIISPDARKSVIRMARTWGLVSIPGVMTPTEIAMAHRNGADFVKLFPAGSMGSSYIKAVLAPLSHVRMLAVGGIDASNIPEFLEAGCRGFGIGGNLVNKNWIEAGEYSKITEAAQAMCRVVGR